MATSKTIVNFDDELGISADEKPVVAKVAFILFGREWTMYADVNSFSLSNVISGDPGAVSQFITNLIVEEQRNSFVDELSKVRNLDGELLGKILGKMIEAAGNGPSKPASPSRSTASKRTSSRRSATS